MNAATMKAISWLTELVHGDIHRLVHEVKRDPEVFLRKLLPELGSLLDGIDAFSAIHEQQLESEIYDDFAQMLAKEFDVQVKAARAWILSQLKDTNFRVTPETQAEAETVRQKIMVPFVMRVLYHRLEGGEKYERTCEIYIQEESGATRRVYTSIEVTWDEILSDVQRHFLESGDETMIYRLYPPD